MRLNHLAIIPLLACMYCPVAAQSVQQATAAYNQYVQAANSGTKAAAYNALYEAYKQNLAVLQQAQKTSADYRTAHTNLTSLWPQLESAAVYYSTQGHQTNAHFMAEAYLSIPMMDDFKGQGMNYGSNLSRLAYFVASRYFNAQEYRRAMPFLELYLRSGDERNRAHIYQCMLKACKEEKQVQKGLSAAQDAVRDCPDDFNLLSAIINFCLDTGEKQALQTYVTRAIGMRPSDQTLQNIQRRLRDNTPEFNNALAANRSKMTAPLSSPEGGKTAPSGSPLRGSENTTAATPNSTLQTPNSTLHTPNSATPLFSQFAKEMIEREVKAWQAKDPYETVAEYQARVTEQARDAKVAELRKVAERDYISTYGRVPGKAQLTLKPYDADHGVFLVESPLGQLVVPVPRESGEARQFEQAWNGVSLENPQFVIAADRLTLAAVTFVTPAGKSYRFASDQALAYTETQVDVHFDAIDYSGLAQNTGVQPAAVTVSQQTVKAGQSDVDTNIPQGARGDDNTFALIIANENYKSVSQVPFTTNDGRTFAQYCHKTLGLPESNVHVVTNATFMDMRKHIKWLTDVLTAYNGAARAIVYYAGHGIPDEATRSAYLLPIDGDGTDVTTGFSLAELYKTLGSIPSRGVTVLLDACFSGATREGGMLASARGVAIKAKPDVPQGSVVVLSAATGDETAWPYKEQGHGLFTYYLLKKLQQSKGSVTLGELSDYVREEVHKRALVVNSKSQTPTVSAPAAIGSDWKNWTLR